MKTLVIGASPNISRFSNKAVNLLNKYNHKVIPIGIKKGKIDDIEIILGQPKINEIHTVTLYISPKKQKEYYNYILSLNPERIIFNPGTENDELVSMAKKHNIKIVKNCTLVMLNNSTY